MEKHANSIKNISIREDLLSDLRALNLAWSTECFHVVLDLFKKKWEQSSDENAREVVQENYLSFWCRNIEQATLINHYRGACIGYVTDNN